jgi:hypothetical protein
MKLAKQIIAMKEANTSDVESWLKSAKEAVEKNTKRPPPLDFMQKTLGWKKGPKYFQVWISTMQDDQKSAFCFIDFEGNIYKAAGWGKVAKGIRGHISKVETSKLDGSTGWLYR